MKLGDKLNCNFFQLLPVNNVSPCKKKLIKKCVLNLQESFIYFPLNISGFIRGTVLFLKYRKSNKYTIRLHIMRLILASVLHQERL